MAVDELEDDGPGGEVEEADGEAEAEGPSLPAGKVDAPTFIVCHTSLELCMRK